MGKKNCRLISIFIIYLLIIIFFSLIYRGFFEHDNSSFVFARDIYQTQAKGQRITDSIEISKLGEVRCILDSLRTRIKKKIFVPDSSFTMFNYHIYRFKISNRFVEFDINENFFGEPRKGELNHLVTVRDTFNAFVNFYNEGLVGLNFKKYPYDSVKVIETLINKRINYINDDLSILNSKKTVKWSLIDFIYFSSITQATVGYGDILPNSTVIRFIVTIQTLIGVFMTVILISFSYLEFKRKMKGHN